MKNFDLCLLLFGNVHLHRPTIEMSTVNADVDTQDKEYETLDTFQDESTQQAFSTPHVYDVVEFPARNVVNADIKDFEITDCAAYSVTGRRMCMTVHEMLKI